MSLNGKVALVVGGGSGIGLGIARALAAEGCRVALAGRTRATLEAAAQAPAFGGKALHRPCDAAGRASVNALFEWLKGEVGPADILVNSQGTNVAKRMFADIDPDEFDMVMGANTTSVFNTMHAAIPAMKDKGDGLIVNVVSVAGLRALKLAGLPYCVSKAAARTIGTFANQELAEFGIRVTSVYPGETNTPILDKRPAPPPEDKRAAMLQPEDVGAAVVAVAKLPPRAVVPEIVISPPYMMLD